jgi:hypothetical protein
VDKAKTKNILEDSKKIDVMSLIEHSTIFSPEGNYLMGEKKKRKKKWGSGPYRLVHVLLS